MISTRQERERLVLDLYYNQGKNTREIAQEARMSFSAIGAILKKAEKEKEAHEEQTVKLSLSSQAYKLFSERKSMAQVAIVLNLREPKVTKFYMEYCKLTQLDSFCRSILEQVDDSVVHVVYSKQFENSSTEKMVSHTWNLIKQFKLNDRISKVFVDASQPGFIRSVLASLGQFQNYEVWIEKSKRDNIPLWKLMHVVPVSFTGEKHKQMLGNWKKLLDKGATAIDPDIHKDLIQELRLASADEDMSLSKKEFSFGLLDSFRLSLEFIKLLIN